VIKTYKCDDCGGIFETERSEDAANAEAKANFGVDDANERTDFAEVCDDCYQAIMAAHRREVLQ